MPRELPSDANLEHLKKQAKAVLRVVRRDRPEWKLADAQHAIARGYGFPNWPALKRQIAPHGHARQKGAPARVLSPPERGPEDALEEHPLSGTWISTDETPRVMLDFAVAGETITLTQVSVSAAGEDIALKITLHADGREHPAEYGQGHVIRACWISPHHLEAVFKKNDAIVGRGTYEVSPDGKRLSVSAGNDLMLFNRLLEVQ